MERRRFETLWNEFVETARRARAPEELRERVQTAIRVAAAGSWVEILNTAPARRGGDDRSGCGGVTARLWSSPIDEEETPWAGRSG